MIPLVKKDEIEIESVQMVSNEPIELAFFMPEQSNLSDIDRYVDVQTAAEHFAHRIARSPLDLRNHIQRIYLYIKSKNSAGIYSALLDLFTALQDNGQALRERMLKSAESLLSPSQLEALSLTIESGLTTSEEMPLAEMSILAKGFHTGIRLVEKEAESTSQSWSPIEEANSYLEYGQIDEACDTLESAVLKTPSEQALHMELLEIYKKTNNEARFNNMIEQLNGLEMNLPDDWVELAKFFEGTA